MREISKAEFIRIMRESKSSLIGIWVVGTPSDEWILERKALASYEREVAYVSGLDVVFNYDGSTLELGNTKHEKRTCYDHGNGILEVRISATLSDGMPYLKHIYYAVKAKGDQSC